ncbi:hypothetical protein DXG01_008252 [Tephrocybe rancida]|nr:hypothetical protein DXG01_008252 [Tephrocybe rancida]
MSHAPSIRPFVPSESPPSVDDMSPMRRNNHFCAIGLVVLLCGLCFLSTWNQDLKRGWREWPASHFKSPPEYVSTLTSIETTIAGSELVYGFGLFDRLYLRSGTLYVVTSTPSNFPLKKHIIARPLNMGPGQDLDPTDRELQFIHPSDASKILGEHAIIIEGSSMIVYDTDQFMNHFYHWWGEIMLGAWRVSSALRSTATLAVDGTQPFFMSRVLLPHIFGQEWKDSPGLNAGLMRAAFPSTSIENADHWDDLASLDKTFVFERAMLVSRVAAHTHKLSQSWRKMISSTMVVNVSETFWEPLRRTTVQNVLGYLPQLDSHGVVVSPSGASEMPVVTYIMRQGSSRRLAEIDHVNLLKALRGLEWSGACQVHAIHPEKMSLAEQMDVMARSSIVIGVHGNGLTHQLWMPHSPRSAVIEIFAPEGYVHDYELLARNMGHQASTDRITTSPNLISSGFLKHYAIWNDTVKSFAPGKWYEYLYPSMRPQS